MWYDKTTTLDSNLETSVREAINKPEGSIYTSDFESLIVFEVPYKGISDFTGLEYCVNLQELVFQESNISDISALAGLINLELLDLGGNNISDISLLADLTNLWGLGLLHNNISDISPLAGLTNLWSLTLSNNNISDISALAGLANLETLGLQDNNINDSSPLVENSGLSAGDTVNLSGNPLSDTSMNVYIPQLEERRVNVIY